MPRFTGTLKTWHDTRGFGFIEPTQGGPEVFVHIKAFPPGPGRPVAGQSLSFEIDTDRNGRKKARAVQLAGSRGQAKEQAARREAGPRPVIPRWMALPAFAAVLAVVAWRWHLGGTVLLGYLAMSAVAFLAYLMDKSAAVAGQWRIPEKTLHLLALAGGWPGALLAQHLLRHKTRKPGFIGVFWLMVVLNVALLVLLVVQEAGILVLHLSN